MKNKKPKLKILILLCFFLLFYTDKIQAGCCGGYDWGYCQDYCETGLLNFIDDEWLYIQVFHPGCTDYYAHSEAFYNCTYATNHTDPATYVPEDCNQSTFKKIYTGVKCEGGNYQRYSIYCYPYGTTSTKVCINCECYCDGSLQCGEGYVFDDELCECVYCPVCPEGYTSVDCKCIMTDHEGSAFGIKKPTGSYKKGLRYLGVGGLEKR